MRRSFALSLLCHGAGLLAAVVLFAPIARERTAPVRIAVEVRPDPPAPELLSPPELEIERPPQPDEEFEPLPTPEPEIETEASEETVVAAPIALRPDPSSLARRLKRPLRPPQRVGDTDPEPFAVLRVVKQPKPKPKPKSEPRAIVRVAELVTGGGIPYPRQARRRGWEGRVELRLRVDRSGAVVRVEIATSSGRDVLDKAARDAAAAWRFQPATRNGRTIASWVRRTVRFRLAP